MIDLTHNPGYKLRAELERIFPYSPFKQSFISRIDEALYADSEFEMLSYRSSLNYLLRRIIVTADFLQRKYNKDYFPRERFLSELRKYLRGNFKFPASSIEAIHAFTIDCLRERRRDLSQAKISHILTIGAKEGRGCYICGKQVIYNKKGFDENHPDLAEVDHLWPRSLGGSNELFNLEISCRRCNKAKTDYIDSSDYHYEKFVIVHDKDHEEFHKDISKEFRSAIFFRRENQCIVCNKKAIKQNKLHICRVDKDDSWHYLNIVTLCDKHATE